MRTLRRGPLWGQLSRPSSRALLVRGKAFAPQAAPAAVKRASSAANKIQGMPYQWGAGHAQLNDWGYDCSGATSYVLRGAGAMATGLPYAHGMGRSSCSLQGCALILRGHTDRTALAGGPIPVRPEDMFCGILRDSRGGYRRRLSSGFARQGGP